jgi:uncharacterized protein with LGFP repeats
MSKQEPSGEVPDINVSGSQGIQVGGTQHNAWMLKQPLDPAAMGALSPHAAVARLERKSHDELVDFFARAKPEDVSEILKVFFEVDLPKLVAALADISRRKATELISMVCEGDGDPLNVLPEAAEAIARKAVRFGWTDAGPLEFLTGGYARKYKGGHVHWSGESGVETTTGVIDDYWTANSRACVVATGDQKTAPSSPFGTDGIQQKFEYGTVYSSKHGVFRVINTEFYEDEGGSGGWLGFPIEEPKSIRRFGRLQRFEGGMTFSYLKERRQNIFAVRREVEGALPDQGWRPVSKETITLSSYGWQGTVQHFEVKLESRTYETAVYSSKWQRGPVMIAEEVWDYYSKLGAENSWLGFPTEQRRVTLPSRLGLGFQNFEAGTIYWRPGSDPFGVPATVMELIKQTRNLREPIGFPMTEEQPIGTAGSSRIQLFENGVVTRRDGKYEIWVRPDSKPGSTVEP